MGGGGGDTQKGTRTVQTHVVQGSTGLYLPQIQSLVRMQHMNILIGTGIQGYLLIAHLLR